MIGSTLQTLGDVIEFLKAIPPPPPPYLLSLVLFKCLTVITIVDTGQYNGVK